MPIQPVKFIKSLYYANKPNQVVPMAERRIKFSEYVPENIVKEVNPYFRGLEQLAKKYNFKIDFGRFSIEKNDNILAALSFKDKAKFVRINENAEGADIARDIYKSVSETLK